MGIAHTRWATCGGKVTRNAHPHFDQTNRFHIVHNGIITNHAYQVWANNAPLLIFVFGKKHFTTNDKPNQWSSFDTGAAWMALALQAHQLGLYTHAMGGFDANKAYEVTGMNASEYDVICAVAIGKLGEIEALPEGLRERETKSERKPINEIAFEVTS